MHEWQEAKTADDAKTQKAHAEVQKEVTALKQKAIADKKEHAEQLERLEEDMATKD